MSDVNNIEQQRADAFSRNLDALLSGASLPTDDPLLDIARLLTSDAVQPGAAATARFEQQLSEWFPPRPPVRPFGRNMLILLLLALIGVIIMFVITANQQPLSATPSTTISATTTFTQVIVSGSIQNIQGSTIIILGRTITIDGTIGRLCAGDAVRIEAILASDGTLHADAQRITVEASTCAGQQTSSSGSGNNRGDMGDDDD
jgi:hypothetical protein